MKGINLAASLDLADPCRLLEPARRAAQAASAAILKTYATDVTALSKDDGSPVTETDEWAEAMTALTVAGDHVETLGGDRKPRLRNPRFIARGAIG
jgi:3'-phosphoadenosine 5'-phosphosulfate (PAPS) 3'-phosphatase